MEICTFSNPRIKRAEAWRLLGLLLLAFVVRWGPSLLPHFWFDEIFTIAMTRYSFGEILRINAADMHPPLFYDWVKCWAMVGLRLGGPCTTLPWLRLAAVLPGIVTCLLGWWIARRYWGPSRGLWTLAAFAVAPALTYYSVDLRSYSSLHALLLGAFGALLWATEPLARRRGPALALFGLCALLAFYTHSLSTLYLGGFGLVLLAELCRDRRLRRVLARPVAVLAILTVLICAPWVRLMFSHLTTLNLELWLPWARGGDLATTFFWFMPLGPLHFDLEQVSLHLIPMTLLAVAFTFLITGTWRNRTQPMPAAEPGAPPLTLGEDRLLIYAGLLAVVPVLVSFILSALHLAKAFLGFRYNLIPAPFITLAIMGMIFRIPVRAWRRTALGLALGVWALCSALLVRQRVSDFDLLGDVTRSFPGVIRPDCRVAWNNPMVLPWLGQRCGQNRVHSLDDILSGRIRMAGSDSLYVLTHLALDVNYGGLLHRPSYLMREILRRRDFSGERIPGKGAWDALWRLEAADVPRLAAEFKQARERIEARRNAIPGGQVVLADLENFYTTHGWGVLQFGPDLLPERWILGTQPHLSWTGPDRPGLYRLRMIFRRPHPAPEKVISIHYRLPGQRDWREQQAGLGQVVIEGDVTVSAPGERLGIALRLPPRNPGSQHSDRNLGMIFRALELHPKD